uniref:cystathionine gamma-lyase n=1 Tax=Rhizochromulina marina TaxID=1034831 RepID=A0A7S2SV58_9STRA|mmetsp:Transcript_9036/g.25825  ORF Transcript_9036/g.25825 Transcript_9036/m.25825 type:complete len:323 (+) Transcript_9036:42-1010(+)
MAAVSAIIQSYPGAHILLPDDVYHGTRTALQTVFSQWATFSTVDFTDLDAVAHAAHVARRDVLGDSGTLIGWVETPSNPMVKVVDIPGAVSTIKDAGQGTSLESVLVVTDATWLTPALCQPLTLGSDVVLHSTTKYIGGHSDLIGGAVICGSTAPGMDCLERVKQVQGVAGAVASPFDCWLVLRGLRSLAARMAMHCQNATHVAEFLQAHPNVQETHYPGLASHPGHALMRDQCGGRGFGGMISFQVEGGLEDAVRVAGALDTFRRATSLGGTESLVEHRQSIEPPDSPTPGNLLRLSVGLEHVEDLKQDLAQALGTGTGLS